MLYYLFDWLQDIDFPGAGVFYYISFRASMASILSLVISLLFGRKIIEVLRKKQIGETVRDLGIDGQLEKKGTPTMGGLIILLSIIVPTLLFGNLQNIYIILMLFTTVWLGMVGFADDYIKVFKKDKAGLSGRVKILGQVVLGLIIGVTMLINEDIIVREKVLKPDLEPRVEAVEETGMPPRPHGFVTTDVKNTKTTIPFLKQNEFDYAYLLWFLGDRAAKWSWLIFIPCIILIVTAVSNGANVTDGLDGLATGLSAIIGTTLGILAYLSGNIIYSDYLNIMYIPFTGEMVIYMAAFVGATVGFLWYNSFPAQVFMGDTGSLSIGGIIAVFAILIRKELLIPVLCGIFFVESLSVIIQVSWFKYTKGKYGEGRRVFRMAPLHHHYQLKGYPEPKIVMRFLIVGILLAVISVVTLKIR
ncbi:MAG: phospho-N-acetylmuramoyl-pentapeptide-transferase [Marinilabiliales bacterium]|nr:MAG: phospho-N-acetylmuramoyl-pentapeptide-transferase [Marinilabiliales bacterium]